LTPGERSQDGIEYVTLDELLQQSDFVSIHALLNDQTRKMIGERELRLMKESAIFVNTSRGQLVDQPALVRALREGWISGAGLDVFEQEPVDPSDPILQLPNVVVTPHAAGTSDISYETGRRLAAEKMARILSGRWPTDVVNPEVRAKTRFLFAD
jgi:phosphoglycerate dehydrogenase-like enzyme